MKKIIIILTLLASMQLVQCMETNRTQLSLLDRARQAGTKYDIYINGAENCSYCMIQAPNSDAKEFYPAYVLHINKEHSAPGMFQCKCGIKFLSMPDAEKHCSTCPEATTLKCTLCGFSSQNIRVATHLCPNFQSQEMYYSQPFFEDVRVESHSHN